MKLAAIFMILATGAFADAPVVEGVKAKVATSGEWRFDVTVSHPDTGWDHYADGWVVEDEAGNVLGLRELAHPHETEQPFTRSLGGVVIPEGTQRVWVRTRCIVDGWSEQVFEVALE